MSSYMEIDHKKWTLDHWRQYVRDLAIVNNFMGRNPLHGVNWELKPVS